MKTEAARIRELEVQVKKLTPDARRYRHLRDKKPPETFQCVRRVAVSVSDWPKNLGEPKAVQCWGSIELFGSALDKEVDADILRSA